MGPTVNSLSETQKKVLRMLAREPNMSGSLGGNGCAPLLSAARALERKGVVQSFRTSHYSITVEYRAMATAELERWRADRHGAARKEPR